MKPLAFVVAIADNGVIGRAGALPWRIPEDLRHFRRVTSGHAIIMGRATWESIGRPLPDRRNFVVSGRPGFAPAGVEVAPTLEDALARARIDDDEPRVIGGATLFRASLPLATRVFLTEVHRDVEGDVLFPFDRGGWREVERRRGEDPTIEFVTLERELAV